ncbi:MAG: hypothetical protein JXJ04_05755, partial [Spirochaetales bacterium]|nr:hypothetical protein [Spirochaetales bacterium]
DIGAEESWYGGIYNNIDRLVNKNDSRGSSPGWYTKIIRIPVNFDPTAADTNCNGNIDIVDALLIAQYYVDLITGFC